MQKVAFLLLVVFSSLVSHAQERLITLKVKDATLAEVLRQISSQSGIPFSYNPRKLPIDQKFSFDFRNQQLETVMTEVCSQAGIRHVRVENQIILQPRSPEEAPRKSNVTFSGFVKDEASGEALIGATILFPDLNVGTVSNAFGFFSITVPQGSYQVSCSFVGYKVAAKNVEMHQSVQDEIRLAEEPPLLKEIVVQETAFNPVTELQASKTDLQPSSVREKPALLGEMDVIKSLESVPGVRPHSDGSTFYYVRGGNRDQNLVLMDDAPIYNPSHLLGFFSTIIPDAVNDITVYRGEMPASMGGRLSSVLDVRTKKGNDQHVSVWGNASFISNKIGVEGPLKKDASSFLLSGRFSRLKWLASRVGNDITQFQFHDLTGKVNFKVTKQDRIYFSFYTGSDNYFGGNSGLTWANNAGTFRWNHIINDRLFLNTTLSGAGYDYKLYTDVAQDNKWNSHISNVSLKNDFSYFARPGSELTFGLSVAGYFFNPGNFQTSNPNASIPALSIRNSAEVAAYINHEWKFNPHWAFNYGLRLTSWSNSGEAFEFKFNQNHQPADTLYFKKGETYKAYGNVEPRATVTYQVNEFSSFKAGFARNVQNVHLITNSVSPFTSMEVWLPSSINIRPQTSNQGSIGYYRTFSRAGLSLMTEVFYKKMNHQIDFASHASTFLNPLVESELRFGSGRSYGVEFQLKKDEGRVRGWVGYSYARSKRTFPDLNQGRTFNAFSDRPHQFNLVLMYDVSLRFAVSANWNYLTGSPYTSPVSYYTFNGESVPIYDQKNNDRLPAYHRLDVSTTWKLNKNPESKFQHSLSFSVFNFYGRKNPLFINYNKVQTGDHAFKVPANLLDNGQAISQFYLFSFTPSLSYNFKWR